MTDIPIIFSAPMVLGLLREVEQPGTGKTMTRRMLYSDREAKGEPPVIPGSATMMQNHRPPLCEFGHYWTLTGWHKVKACDRLWVRESVALRQDDADTPAKARHYAKYRASHHDSKPDDPMDYHRYPNKWTPSIHMPRIVSRLTLIVTGTKIERLQDISEADARAEGCPIDHNGIGYKPPTPEQDSWQGYGRYSFCLLWSSLHGRESWDANPWVVALSFRVILANIDDERAAA